MSARVFVNLSAFNASDTAGSTDEIARYFLQRPQSYDFEALVQSSNLVYLYSRHEFEHD
jgi:hypothetical protein